MAAYVWENKTLQALWRPRDGAGLLSFDNALWLLGGWRLREDGPTGPGSLVDTAFVGTAWTVDSEVWRSDDHGCSWTCVQPQCAWAGRHTAGYAVHAGRMWVIGGDIYTNSADVWSSSDGIEWACHTDDAPWGGRVLPYVTSFNGALWLMGGQAMPQFAHYGASTPALHRPGKADAFYSDVWRSEDGESWERVMEHAQWGPRGMIGAPGAVKDGYLWLFSGGTYETPDKNERQFCNDVWRTRDGVEWECVLEAAPWGARQYSEIAAFDDRLWVVCGYGIDATVTTTLPMESEALAAQHAGNRKDVWCSRDGVEWLEVADSPFLPRHASSVCVHGDALVLMAGNAVAPDGSWDVCDVWALRRKAAAPML